MPTRSIRSLLAPRSLASTLVCLALASVAWAHHGWSSYDANKVMKFDAELAQVRYRNPHAEVEVDYGGKRWLVILAPIRRMESRGLPSDALEVGKTVTIEGYPRSDGTAELRAERITVDGKTIELR
ncbi:MAG: hypothetical protein GX535_07490 [Xanthomonadaceae bacterium]|nr:hypothetical protein [Xanthomonadaceae bacterium]